MNFSSLSIKNPIPAIMLFVLLTLAGLMAYRANAPFKAGMFASGQFELGTSNAMTVPQQAVVVRDGFSYVFQLKPDSRVSQVKVQPGRRLGERIEVLAGLVPGATVAVSGAGFLNEGDMVRVVAAAPQAK